MRCRPVLRAGLLLGAVLSSACSGPEQDSQTTAQMIAGELEGRTTDLSLALEGQVVDSGASVAVVAVVGNGLGSDATRIFVEFTFGAGLLAPDGDARCDLSSDGTVACVVLDYVGVGTSVRADPVRFGIDPSLVPADRTVTIAGRAVMFVAPHEVPDTDPTNNDASVSVTVP